MHKSAQTREDTKTREDERPSGRAKTSEDERRRAKTSEDERRRAKTSEDERRRAKTSEDERRRSASLGARRRSESLGARRRSALGVARRSASLGARRRSALGGASRRSTRVFQAKTREDERPREADQGHPKTHCFNLISLTSSASLGVTYLRSASFCVAPRRAVSSSATIGLRWLGDYVSVGPSKSIAQDCYFWRRGGVVEDFIFLIAKQQR